MDKNQGMNDLMGVGLMVAGGLRALILQHLSTSLSDRAQWTWQTLRLPFIKVN